MVGVQDPAIASFQIGCTPLHFRMFGGEHNG
jgi:hypothetical protein